MDFAGTRTSAADSGGRRKNLAAPDVRGWIEGDPRAWLSARTGGSGAGPSCRMVRSERIRQGAAPASGTRNRRLIFGGSGQELKVLVTFAVETEFARWRK